ncbi:dynein regulatory complex protein 1 [Schistocerca americana]|uniref:dynein regulatory complex protein 1 n=1 Tax=Schistocerca americana TaxID=7009 RepID=UPI001F50073F|nr:dynein regulatory complex protein 1 [Schistocerca americana]
MEGISLQESEELKVTSDDPNERKLARRQRIQRRLEAAKRQHIVDEEEVQEEKGKSLLDEQVENSADQLEKLLLEGRELVTNVRVASDSREVKHREELAIAREKRTKVVEEEAEKSLKKFEEIDQKWSSILVSKDPLDIHHAMEEQKVKCRELIEQKNMLIEELRHELKQADIRFHEDQKKQKDDVVTLAERIDNQVNVMRRAYRQELRLIEQAIEIERKQLLDTNKKRWDPLYSERETEEIENMEKKFQQVAEFEEEMRKIDLEHEENYRESKIKLETDIQILQQELEQIKASCLLNSEKLDYNYLILKKRVDENIILKCQQKRQINKLQGMVNSLKKNIAEIENITKNESDHLRNDIIKLHDKLMKLDERTDYLSQINDTKYHQLWDMNQEKATKLLQKILAADKFIHEELLGLTWVPPDFPKMKKTDLPSYQAAVKAVDNLTEKKVECTGADVQKKIHSDIDTSDDNTNMLLKHILQKIADESQFLIEECLNKLLFLHRKDGKTLVKLDNVFSALGVTKKEDIMLMKEFFLPYTFCPICSDLKADEKKSEEVTSEKIDSMYRQEQAVVYLVCPQCIKEKWLWLNIEKICFPVCCNHDLWLKTSSFQSSFINCSEKCCSSEAAKKKKNCGSFVIHSLGLWFSPQKNPRYQVAGSSKMQVDVGGTFQKCRMVGTNPDVLCFRIKDICCSITITICIKQCYVERHLPLYCHQCGVTKRKIVTNSSICCCVTQHYNKLLHLLAFIVMTMRGTCITNDRLHKQKKRYFFFFFFYRELPCMSNIGHLAGHYLITAEAGIKQTEALRKKKWQNICTNELKNAHIKQHLKHWGRKKVVPTMVDSKHWRTSEPKKDVEGDKVEKITTEEVQKVPTQMEIGKSPELLSQESGETAVPPSESVASVQSMDEQISEESHPGSSQHVETQPTPEQKPMKSSPPTVEEMALQKDRTMDCVLTHHVKINPVYVLKALREFISDFSSKRQQTYVNLESRLSRKRDTVSRLLSTDDVTAYWKKFENIFSPKAIQLWDCLYTGLQKYHCVLKERHRLNVETQQLQHQNTELRRLLRGYILSPGNERMTPISKKILPPVFQHIKKTEAINFQE